MLEWRHGTLTHTHTHTHRLQLTRNSLLSARTNNGRAAAQNDGEASTVFPRIDARAFISFTTLRTRRLNEAGATVWQAKGATGTLNSL